MEEKLSSSMTLFYKIILPALWISGFGFGTLGMWLGKFDQPSQPPDEVKLTFLFFWIIGSAFLLRDAVRLKSITQDKNDLIIKNFSKVIRVPLSNIHHISESRLMRPKTISITITPPCEFGERVTFIPKAKLQLSFNPLSEHPIAKRLRELAGSKSI